MENSIVESGNIMLDLSLIPLVHDYLSGKTIAQCAIAYNISEIQASEFINRREVKQYISSQLKNKRFANRQKRIEVLSDIIDEKITLAEENELPLSNKDIVEVLKLLREENNDLEKLSGDMEQDSGKAQYIQIINQLKC